MSLANKFNIPPALFETIKKMNEGKAEYQAKVKALMAKRGIKSLADLSPEEKKDFFNTLDSMHKAKNEEVEQIDEISLKDRLAGKTAPIVKSKYNRTKANRPMTGKELERHNKSKQLAFEKMPAPEHTKGYTLKHKSTHEVEGELGDATDHYYHILKDGKKVGEHYFAGYFGHGTVRLHGNEETDTGYIGSTERLQHWMKTKAGFRSVFGKKEGEQKHAEYVAKHGIKKYPGLSEEVDLDEETQTYMVKFEKNGKVSLKNYEAKSDLDARSKAKVDAKRMGMNVSSVRLKEEVEELDEVSADVAKRVAQARNRSAEKYKLTPTQSRRLGMGDKGGEPDLNAAKALKSAMKRGAKNVYGEEVELDEVLDTPSKTLGYLAKATVSGLKSGALGTGKFRKRQAGIQTAIRKTKEKIANEEVEQIEEGMSTAQIKKLRDAYGNIDKIDVSGQPYKNLVAFLDKQNLDTLKMLAGAKIKFISPLAQNRVIRKMNEDIDESIGSTVGGALGQYAGSKMGLEGPGRVHGEVLGRKLEMFARAILKKLTKEEIELTESDFKIGDDVICKDSGMEGEVVKIDEPQTGKYYTVKREDGKMVKYAPDELKAEDEDDDDEKEDMEEASSSAQQAAIAIAMKKAGKTPKNEEVEELDEISAETAKSVAQKRDLHFRKGTPTETQKRRMGRGDWRADPSLHADKARQSAEKRGAKDVYDYNKKEEVEFDEASNPQISMKRAGLSVERAKEVMRHQKEIGSIRKKREALRNSYDPSIVEAYKKMKNKKKEVTKDDNQIVKSSDKLSGKQEPIELEPELKEQKS